MTNACPKCKKPWKQAGQLVKKLGVAKRVWTCSSCKYQAEQRVRVKKS